jgi:hypothetical protein
LLGRLRWVERTNGVPLLQQFKRKGVWQVKMKKSGVSWAMYFSSDQCGDQQEKPSIASWPSVMWIDRATGCGVCFISRVHQRGWVLAQAVKHRSG